MKNNSKIIKSEFGKFSDHSSAWWIVFLFLLIKFVLNLQTGSLASFYVMSYAVLIVLLVFKVRFFATILTLFLG